MPRSTSLALRDSRRGFLAALVGVAFLPVTGGAERPSLLLATWCGRTAQVRGPHPVPRPGITAARVLPADQLASMPDLIPLFDKVREIPEILDGIRCHCGCPDPPTFYSLLSCYEGEAMSRFCDICQGQANLAHRLHRAGESLDGIRAAIDARYGNS